MQVEQETEQIREANQLLEASTQRREALEKAMRRKLEEELRQQKETNLQLQGEYKKGGGRGGDVSWRKEWLAVEVIPSTTCIRSGTPGCKGKCTNQEAGKCVLCVQCCM